MIDILNPKLILSASQEEAEFLQKVFPQLPKAQINFTEPFFTVKDLRSKAEFDRVKSLEPNYVIISNVLFDEQVTDETLKELALSFVQTYFKSRKKVIHIPEHAEILPYLNDFIFDLQAEEAEADIIRLFDSVGTRQFPQELINITQTNPPQKIISAVTTFLSKLETPTSLFYKKASERLLRKYKSNYRQAAESYAFSYRPNLNDSDNVLLFIKYHSDLFQC